MKKSQLPTFEEKTKRDNIIQKNEFKETHRGQQALVRALASERQPLQDAAPPELEDSWIVSVMNNYENVISKLHLSHLSVFNELIRIAHHFYRE